MLSYVIHIGRPLRSSHNKEKNQQVEQKSHTGTREYVFHVNPPRLFLQLFFICDNMFNINEWAENALANYFSEVTV